MQIARNSASRIAAHCATSRCVLCRPTPGGLETQLKLKHNAAARAPQLVVPSVSSSGRSLRTRTFVAMAAVPKTQVAVRLTSFDQDKIDDGFANVEVHKNVGVPEPGDGEVLVRFTQRPVQTSDLSVARGLYGPKPFPSPMGQEGVGVIAKLGPNTGKLKEGTRVIGTPWDVGTWQQYAAVKESNLIAAADQMDDKTAAQAYTNPLTAVGLVETAAVPQGKYLLQSAAASIVGRMVIQYAKHLGVKTINIVRRPEQVQELKGIGADDVIDSSSEDVDKCVAEITGDEGAYAGIDPVATDQTAVVLHNVRKGGIAFAFGALTGSKAHVNIMDLMASKKLEGFMLTTWLGEGRNEKLARTQRLLADGILTPLSGRSFPLEQVREAIAESQKPGRGAKVFLES